MTITVNILLITVINMCIVICIFSAVFGVNVVVDAVASIVVSTIRPTAEGATGMTRATEIDQLSQRQDMKAEKYSTRINNSQPARNT